MEESIGQQLINKIRKSGEKHDLLVERHKYEQVLLAIASKFNGLPDDFISPTEKSVADILVEAGFLQKDNVETNGKYLYSEYVMASPSN